ncbi:MAG: DUF4398 domain-containing protein [Wenzhouxiangellaceae bacterium]|nr:DUF4398 domain-containing protein [Wenzhouxiangellaceae bacterium]
MLNKSLVQILFATIALSTLGACVTTSTDPSVLLQAVDAIELAERAAAEEHAPLELEEARELREQAEIFVEEGETADAVRWVERATLQARLAVARAEGSIARSELEQKRRELQQLEAELQESFGDAMEPGR